MPLDDKVLGVYREQARLALDELDQLERENKLTADAVCAWMAKWKDFATYKHLGIAMKDRAEKASRP